MLTWLIKTLWRQKGGVLTSATGVALALVLVVVMDAAFVGESNQIVAYIRHKDADVWVMQQGVNNMHMATTFVWDWKAERIANLPGVNQATAILYVNTVIKAGGRNWFTYVLGLEPDGQRAGPWLMASGKSHPGPGEIVLPQVFSDMTGLMLGDKAEIADQEFTIVGFSSETFSMANSIAFVSFSDLEEVLSTSGTISFVLVDAEPGQNTQELAARIEQQVDKVTAIPQQRFIDNDLQIALLMGVEIVSFMTIIGSVLASLIVAFTVYSQMIRRKRELAIAKALGWHNKSLYLAAFVQTAIVTSLAFGIALLISLFLLPVLSALVPQITLDVTAEALIRMGVIALVIAMLVTIIPARMIARVDPITALKV
jgi:putative ABC transport system permease protein